MKTYLLFSEQNALLAPTWNEESNFPLDTGVSKPRKDKHLLTLAICTIGFAFGGWAVWIFAWIITVSVLC